MKCLAKSKHSHPYSPLVSFNQIPPLSISLSPLLAGLIATIVIPFTPWRLYMSDLLATLYCFANSFLYIYTFVLSFLFSSTLDG